MDVGNVERIGYNPIAGGGFADVWRGYHSDQEVALKVIRVYGQTESGEQILRVRPSGICLLCSRPSLIDYNQTFCAEALVWHRVQHRHVMPFIGVCVIEFAPQYALVSPWMKNGNMSDYIRKEPSCDRISLVR